VLKQRQYGSGKTSVLRKLETAVSTIVQNALMLHVLAAPISMVNIMNIRLVPGHSTKFTKSMFQATYMG
jgi:hypothetical protein